MKVGIIGAGAMGGAFVRGLLKKQVLDAGSITLSDPNTSQLADLKESGVGICYSNKTVAKESDFLLVAVKPWLVSEVIAEIKGELREQTEVCLILAGVSSGDLREMFGEENPGRVSIAIPNTAMVMAESMTFLVDVFGKPESALKLFSHLGEVMEIEERLLPGATALASCGIAYAMRYVRAACEGGVELGFRASQAQEIVAQTLAGAVALLRQPGAHPESEIDKVTTPGGITIKGLNAMESHGFTTAVIEGLKAAR